MTSAVEASVSGTLAELSEATRTLLDSEDGELVALLTHFGSELGGMLDPFRRDSAGAELAQALRLVMEKTLEAHARQVRQLVDPEAPESPIGRMVGVVRDQTNILGEEVRRLAEVIVTDRARAEGLDRSGAKGIPYEQALFNVVAEVAAVSGDTAEHVGRDRGAAGNQKGDIVVHLSPNDTAGRPLCTRWKPRQARPGSAQCWRSSTTCSPTGRQQRPSQYSLIRCSHPRRCPSSPTTTGRS